MSMTPNAADGGQFKKEKIVRLINSVIKRVEHTGSADATRETIYEELKALKRIIDESRAELGRVRAGEINAKDLPDAKDELDAVIEATAQASSTIMDACDAIQEFAGAAGEAGEKIIAETTKIFEACSFQDITGQRIKKVVTTLKSIDERVQKLVAVLGGQISGDNAGAGGATDAPQRTGDEALLNGPQLPANAITQDDIDKLLAEFGD